MAGKNVGMAGVLIDTEGYYPTLSVEYKVKELLDVKKCLQL
ncbi:MAG: hypothetical protein J6S10_02830 [Clostridia bacterium]|nr:hypothetical protein [Clostridia bacterium]